MGTSSPSANNWRPQTFLDQPSGNLLLAAKNFALVVLNRPINTDVEYTLGLWNAATIRVLVDGGGDRWLTFLDSLEPHSGRNVNVAEMLTGDFDSISPTSKQRLSEMGTEIISTPDQDETDFTKALKLVQSSGKKIDSIVTLVDSGGRVDHTMANINTMCKALRLMPEINVYAVCDVSMSWMLEAGEHIIEIPQQLVEQHRWCSYVPIDGSCSVTTQGFMWDLENFKCGFGGMVSTSNTYARKRISIKTDGRLFWSMGIGDIKKEE